LIFKHTVLTIKTIKGYAEWSTEIGCTAGKENLESKNRSLSQELCDYLKKICYSQLKFLHVLYQGPLENNTALRAPPPCQNSCCLRNRLLCFISLGCQLLTCAWSMMISCLYESPLQSLYKMLIQRLSQY
jgi:hypothetical protein